MSSRGSIMYGVAKEMVNIPPHHIRNTQHFIEEAKSIQIQQGETMSSYDVKAFSPQFQWTFP